MWEETSKLEQFVINWQLEPHVCFALHLIGHDIVTDRAKRCLKDQLLLTFSHFGMLVVIIDTHHAKIWI